MVTVNSPSVYSCDFEWKPTVDTRANPRLLASGVLTTVSSSKRYFRRFSCSRLSFRLCVHLGTSLFGSRTLLHTHFTLFLRFRVSYSSRTTFPVTETTDVYLPIFLVYMYMYMCVCVVCVLCVCIYSVCECTRVYVPIIRPQTRTTCLGTARVTLTSRATSVGRRIGYRGNLPIPPRQRAPITKRILRARGDRTVPGRVRTNTERGERESEQGRGELGGSRVSRAA